MWVSWMVHAEINYFTDTITGYNPAYLGILFDEISQCYMWRNSEFPAVQTADTIFPFLSKFSALEKRADLYLGKCSI